ncbi:hypothetical protein [Paraburkholderia sp. J41]|uniref:hypothetical protein n=1 Tax=Paraburkholderia sp. J41 TaxID=2805433 RepID=UPI002AC35666|nr:hypothetical protein [Paraburkholderia sp. J41]
MLALLVAIATCATAWALTSEQPARRRHGSLIGLVNAILWTIAGLYADKGAVVAVAMFCALCFARAYARGRIVGGAA